MNRKRRKIPRGGVYAILVGVILWQAILLFRELTAPASIGPIRKITVNVSGNVERPGQYRVAEGTTQFEILQVAGVRSTSDITPFNLMGQLEEDQKLDVGSLENPVGLKSQVRLEFFLGDIQIVGADGRDRQIREGIGIDEGDRVMTQEKSQAELSINSYSRVDIDNFTEVVFDKIDEEKGKAVVELFQKNGMCWYQMVYTEQGELFKVVTPLASATVGAKGADFTVEVDYAQVSIANSDGLLLIERPDGGEAINLIAGQTVTIYDDGRPFQVSELAPDISVTDRFSQLSQIKTDMMMQHLPFNFLFCALPFSFYVISVQFDRNEVHTISIPANTSVDQFAQGFSTIQQALLYGGPVFASTLIERIMDAKIPKYAVFDRDDVIRVASSIGGIQIDVDATAASTMGVSTGSQKLAGQSIVNFLKPSVSGPQDSGKRQMKVLHALFNGLKSNQIVVTALLADQILANIDANLSTSEILKHYKNFGSRSGWDFKSYNLPIDEVMREGRTIAEPDLDKARTLLAGE